MESLQQYPSSLTTSPPILPGSSNAIPSNLGAKADQIMHRIYTKFLYIVADARTSSSTSSISQSSSPYDTDEGVASPPLPPRGGAHLASALTRGDRNGSRQPRSDKWFNIETPEYDQHRSTLAVYRSLSAHAYSRARIEPLQISVLLAVPPTAQASGVHHALNVAKVLVHRFDASSGEGEHHTRVTRVTPTPLSILLETHTLSFSTENSLEEVSVELPQVYKQTVSLFRSLFTLLRTLPAWKLQRKLRRARQSSSSANLSLVVRVVVGRPQWIEEEDVAGFNAPQSQPAASLATEAISFPPITTPIGSFTMRTIYRSHPHYALESLESLLSHHFLEPSPSSSEYRRDLSAGAVPSGAKPREPVHFTPTITSAAERQRKESFPSSSPRSPLPLPIPDRVKSFPPHANHESSPRSNQIMNTNPDRSPSGSLPTRTSLPQSPIPGSAPISVPFRQALNNSSATRDNNGQLSPTSSLSSSPRPRRISALGSASSGTGTGVEFPASLSQAHVNSILAGAGGASASGSSPKFGFSHGREPSDLPFAVGLGSGKTSGTIERTRKESLLGTNSGLDRSPSTMQTQHTRRPSINSIHPFKSGTVSSSPSSTSFRSPQPPPAPTPFIRTPSTNPSMTSLLMGVDSVRQTPSVYHDSSGRVASPLPGGTFTSPDSPERPPIDLPSHRYSSSFSHRPPLALPTSATTGEASSGSAPRLAVGRPGSLINESPIRRLDPIPADLYSDDDGLSEFVRAIDTRAPLRGGRLTTANERGYTGIGSGDVEFPIDGPPSEHHSETSPLLPTSLNSPQSRDSVLSRRSVSLVDKNNQSWSASNPAMFTSRADVAATLRRMTESFQDSLERELRSRRLRTQSASSANSTHREGVNGHVRRVSAFHDAPLPEDENGDSSSASGSPIGSGVRRIGHAPSNTSSSSLFAGGRRSYDSGEQIVGRMDFGEEDSRAQAQSTDTATTFNARNSEQYQPQEDRFQTVRHAPFARGSRKPL